jgi:hypothetical protein
MRQTSKEIAKTSHRCVRASAKASLLQVRNFLRQAEQERGREKGRGSKTFTTIYTEHPKEQGE